MGKGREKEKREAFVFEREESKCGSCSDGVISDEKKKWIWAGRKNSIKFSETCAKCRADGSSQVGRRRAVLVHV